MKKANIDFSFISARGSLRKSGHIGLSGFVERRGNVIAFPVKKSGTTAGTCNQIVQVPFF
ncbi:hypothetical protein [Olivibacter jilunii]|uniref:hypothetical protein n=1 Tax=Olivibacter jilunii TaxID=985016 RepID=UPI00102F5068|nr:hypothetical protein [Olivibacter jilunii]